MNSEWITYLSVLRGTRIEKGGPGSGNWGHHGRKGKRGGSVPARGGAGVTDISLSSKTSDAQFAEQISGALSGHNFGTSVPVKITHTERGETTLSHVIQHRLGGRVTLAREAYKHGEPYQIFYSFSLRGKNRGKMRYESEDPHRWLVERGLDPNKGFLTRSEESSPFR